MADPWESIPETKLPATPKPNGIAVLLLGLVCYFAGSYYPSKLIDFDTIWNRRHSESTLEKDSWVVIIEETDHRAKFPWLANVITDRDYWDGLKASGLKWQLYDIDSPSVESYRAEAEKVGLPALFVISPSGVVKLAKSCPPTTESIDELLKRVR